MTDQPWLEKRRDKARGIDFVVDVRSAEEVAAVEAEHQAKKAAELAALGSSIAYFDEQGICRTIGDASAPIEGFAYSKPVAPGTRISDVTINTKSGRINKTKPATVSIPEAHPAGETLTIPLPDGVVAEVEGEPVTGQIKISSDVFRRVPIELHGKQRGSFIVEFQTYAERRAADYAPISEQLDMLYHDPEVWRAHVEAVKVKHPKGSN